MRSAVLPLLVTLALAGGVAAQSPPSEAQIRADVRANINSNAVVTLRGNGSRQLNGGVYEFVHSITARYPFTGYPGVEVEAYHDVVYQSHGSRYVFDRVRVGDWRYFGIPAPSVEEIQAIVDTDDVTPYTNEGGVMVLDRSITVDETEVPTKPDRATAHGTARYKVWVSEGWVQDVTAEVEITAFRETLDQPWNGFRTDFRNKVEGARSPMPEGAMIVDQYARMQGQIAEASDVPEVTVPTFGTRAEAIAFVYRMFRETTDPARIEAYLRALAPDSYFLDEGRRALDTDNNNMARYLVSRIDDLFRFGWSFAEATCERPVYFEQGDTVYFQGVLDLEEPGSTRYALSVGITRDDGGYVNGRAVEGPWVLYAYEPRFHASADDLARIRSISDRSSLCSASGQAVQAATQGAQEATQGTTDRARGAVEGAVQEGRRRLGRLLGRGGN